DGRCEPGLAEFLSGELLARPSAAGTSPVHLWSRLACVAARRKPLVLVLDDVHEDPEVAAIALSMTRHARREGARLLCVLAARPESLEGELGQILGEDDGRAAAVEGRPRVVRLGPLPTQDAEALVHAAFHPNDFDTTAPWLGAHLASVSGGNPLFLTSL